MSTVFPTHPAHFSWILPMRPHPLQNISADQVIRHYDVTEKLCPLYYVEHEDAWIQMKADIQAYADSLS